MKGITSSVLMLFLALGSAFSQIYQPVKWSYAHEMDGADHAVLQFTAKIDKGWHVYATKLESDMGPVATAFDFTKIAGAELAGGIVEPKPHKEYDPNFQMELSWFEGTVTFEQRVKLTSPRASISGELTYMTCDASKCLPPEYLEFHFDIEVPAPPAGVQGDKATTEPTTAPPASDAAAAGQPASEGEAASEILEPVKWRFETENKGNGVHLVRAIATIDKGWHVYSIHLPSEDGPVATALNLLGGKYEKTGELREIGELHKEYDPNFMMELSFYEETMTLELELKPLDNELIKGEVYYMCCDAEKCLPPVSVEFSFDPATGSITMADETPVENIAAATPELRNLKLSTIDLDNPANQCGTTNTGQHEDSGFWGIFLLGFLGGLVALLTPCVFPMIPLTVSFFTKGSENRRKGLMNAFLYGFSIFLIYIILSLPFHFLDSVDSEILNTISTNAWLNVAFFVIFVVFAISFFGYFEITLPSSIANKADSASNIGGLLGIFFMALTLAIVSFSCTGPILGSLLAGSLTSAGGAMQLTAGMGGFGLALALPFGLFAAFPGWLNSLPRSGSWLTNVKVVLGFVELALAVKFFSNADLVEHWGLLKREVFFALWIIIGIGLALYLLGLLRFPHDNPNEKIGWARKSLAVLTIAFVLYLTPGLTNTAYANLKLLSGFPPPLFYSLYEQESNCPLNIQCFKDYEEGLSYAREHNKPIMIDFTGWACVNCRRMEENVWVNREIYDRLNEDYVLISLYVDDRKELPAEEQFEYVTVDGRKKKIKTVGNKWATLQAETFKNNSQPYYVLMSPGEELLNAPVGYTPDVNEYKQFLDCGLEAFEQKAEVANAD